MPRLSLPVADEVPLYEGNLEADLAIVSRNQLAEQITGGLSLTTKMPCPSWGISAHRCRIGSVLAQKPGSTCHACYALRGRYRFEAVQRKLEVRYRGLFNPYWTPAMVFLVRWYADRYFRWFDSGDLVDVQHLRNIATVAEHTPDVRHWLPTRETEVVRACPDIPINLVIRVSGTMIDGRRPKAFERTSTVVSLDPEDGSFLCPAPEQGGCCAKCRACWHEQGNVAYRLH